MTSARASIPLATFARNCVFVSASMAGADATCQFILHRAAEQKKTMALAKAKRLSQSPQSHQQSQPQSQPPPPRSTLQQRHPENWMGSGEWLDLNRTARFAVLGLLLSGPLSQGQHIILERLFPGNAAKEIAFKVAGGAGMAPLTLSLNFAFLGAMKGKSAEETKDKIARDLGPTWLAGACYWPFVMAVTFRLVPLEHRAIAASSAGALWQIYLSNQADRELEDEGSFLERLGVVSATE